MKLCIKIFLLVLSFYALNASAWWNDDWTFRKELQVDMSGLGTQSNSFPVLIRLSGGNFGFFYDVLPKAEDIRFLSSDDKTPLKYHVEKFDPVAEMALIWVQVPRAAAGSTPASAATAPTQTVYMYYGNPAAADAADKTGTYDVNQALVYHFDELAQAPRDATAYANQPVSYQGETNVLGLIGNAAKFSANQGLQTNGSSSMRFVPSSGSSISFWVQANDVQAANSQLLFLGDSAQYIKVLISGSTPRLMVQTATQKVFEVDSALSFTSQVWHHLGLILDTDKVALYIDGKLAAQIPVALSEFSPSLTIGAGQGANGVAINVDELQLSNSARGVDWFVTAVANQAVGSDIVIFGGDESAESGGQSNYFIGILSSVSIDGWVVIGLLAILAFMSWLVVIGKSIVISKTAKDNRLFIAKFKALDDELMALDQEEDEDEKELQNAPLLNALFGKHDHFQSSNLYHLYHVAMQSLAPRVGKSVGAASVLSPEGLAVVKASLDATMVREQQKLNKMMVLLTIAISGGPFLGLLGTVLGVMITFAAIAISGDVDIGAIAPGVSAALMTTVAGLFVAIPALFAYNYLSTRIRDLSIDMRVFSDELVAKIAEYHR